MRREVWEQNKNNGREVCIALKINIYTYIYIFVFSKISYLDFTFLYYNLTLDINKERRKIDV